METIYIAHINGNPSKNIIIFHDNEMKAWKVAAEYFSSEIVKHLLPSEYINEEGEQDLYFPTAVALSDIIILKKYEIEDGYAISVYSEVVG